VNKAKIRLLGSLCVLFFLSPIAHAADFLKPTAVIDRTPGKKIRLSITWSKISKQNQADLAIDPKSTDSARKALIRLLDICLVTDASTECGDSVLKANYFRDPTLDQTPETNRNKNITADVLSNTISFVTDATDNTLTINADIEVISQDPALPVNKDTTRISLRIVYKDGEQTKTETENDIRFTYAQGVNDVPQNVFAIGSKESLNAAWDQADSVLLADGKRGRSTGVLAILVPQSRIGTTLLPTRVYNADYEQQTDQSTPSCGITFTTADDMLSCAVTCEGDSGQQTINAQDLSELASSGVEFKQIASAERSVFFNDLDIQETYAIVLQFEPDGLQRSCIAGRASDAYTLTQLQTGREPTAGDPSCFIATAAYGSTLDPHLDTLRWFRDRYLLQTEWGRSFVRSYYRWGPHAAQWLRDKPLARQLTRGVLWLPVVSLELWKNDSSLLLTLSLVLSAAAIGLLWRRRHPMLH
jgi:hypothetical protein